MKKAPNRQPDTQSPAATRKLPQRVLALCREAGIRAEDILYWADCDETADYHFTEGYVLLTRRQLAVIVYPPLSNQTYSLGGYRKEALRQQLEANIQVYPLQELTGTKIQQEIGRICLVLLHREGAIRAAFSSNSLLGFWLPLEKLVEKLIKGEELTEKDLKPEKKEAFCPHCGTLYPDPERKICPRCMDRKSVFGRILRMYLAHKGKLTVMVLCFLATSVLNLLWPYFSGTILYDRILAQDETFAAWLGAPGTSFLVILGWSVAAMLLSKLIVQLLGILQTLMTSLIVPKVVASVRSQAFTSMGKLSVSFYNKKQTGSLMTRVMSDANEVNGFFIDGVPFFIVYVITLILMAVVMFSLNPVMAVVSLALLVPLVWFSLWMMPRVWSAHGRMHRARRSLNSQVNDNVKGARVVKAFGQEEPELARFGHNNDSMKQAELGLAKYDNRYDGVYLAVENIAQLLAWSVGAWLILRGGHMEAGMLLTFTAYISQLNGPLDFFSYCFRWWTQSMNSAQRIFEIIDSIPEITEKEDAVSLNEIQGKVEFRNVSFAYETGKPVLKHISFTVQPGEMLGIVGRSGAGKTTLVNLLTRLYDATEGDVYIDDVNVRDLTFASLHGNIAMVSQETYIFMGTVAENIAYARPDATCEEILRASIQASAHDFICKMPQGYDTVIGSSGRELSGGERQRISIARAILADPKILILDEATAAVDTETELAIQASLDQLTKGRTTLSIAHRLSTLKNADRLVVLDDGKLTEEGTHRSLIEKKGTYYKLMQLQTKALAMRGLE